MRTGPAVTLSIPRGRDLARPAKPAPASCGGRGTGSSTVGVRVITATNHHRVAGVWLGIVACAAQ